MQEKKTMIKEALLGDEDLNLARLSISTSKFAEIDRSIRSGVGVGVGVGVGAGGEEDEEVGEVTGMRHL